MRLLPSCDGISPRSTSRYTWLISSRTSRSDDRSIRRGGVSIFFPVSSNTSGSLLSERLPISRLHPRIHPASCRAPGLEASYLDIRPADHFPVVTSLTSVHLAVYPFP